MSPYFSCITFNDPVRALNHANNLGNPEWNSHIKEDYNYYSDSEQFVQNTLNSSEKKLSDEARYNEISVVVIDYDMPEMDGLSFCRNLKNPNIKKILLTGQVRTEDAITAFNDNVIDYYMTKSDENLVENLLKAIREMQTRYFIDISSYIKIRAIESNNSLFNDTKLSKYFSEVLNSYHISEYYFSTSPPRYRLKDNSGEQFTFLVYSRSDLNEQIRVIKEEAGPEWLLKSLKSGHYVPFFRTGDGYYDQDVLAQESSLFLAEKINGNDTYFCALIKDNDLGIDPRLMNNDEILH